MPQRHARVRARAPLGGQPAGGEGGNVNFEPRRHTPLLVASWWVALMIGVMAVRPLTPVDETRVLAVAWEMRQTGDWLVLHLNGALYGHKPPLIYWLINLGWTAFGVNEWWPRLLTGLFGLAALAVIAALARRLAPQRDDIAAMTVMITASGLGWTIFTGAIMFDLMLAFFVAVAMLNIVRAGAGERGAWSWVGAAIGLAILTKGPVALVHILLPALLAPWWLSAPPVGSAGWGRWYRGVGLAVLVGAAVALAWAIPTAIVGGEAFRREILWNQSVDRMISSDHHARPFWYYLPLLPVLLSPWLIFAPVWRGFVALMRGERMLVVRFALAWGGAVLIAFSLFKTKLIYYLLPASPAFALLAAAGLAVLKTAPRRAEIAAIALLLMLGAVALVVAPQLPRVDHLVGVDERPLLWLSAVVLMAAAVTLFVWPLGDRVATVGYGVDRLRERGFVARSVRRSSAGCHRWLRRSSRSGANWPGSRRQVSRSPTTASITASTSLSAGFRDHSRIVPRADELLAWAKQHPDGSVVVYSPRPLTHRARVPRRRRD